MNWAAVMLLNGTDGNYPKGTSSKEYLFPEDLDLDNQDFTTFYDLDPEGVGFVFYKKTQLNN